VASTGREFGKFPDSVANKLSLIISEQLAAVVIPSNYDDFHLSCYEVHNHSCGGKGNAPPSGCMRKLIVLVLFSSHYALKMERSM